MTIEELMLELERLVAMHGEHARAWGVEMRVENVWAPLGNLWFDGERAILDEEGDSK